MNYLKPSLSDNEVFKIIQHHILSKTAFCLTRFGDGEIFFLNNNVPENLQKKVCELWNYHWPSDFDFVRSEVVDIIQRGLNGSDIIGLLDPNNPICKILHYDPNKWSIRPHQVNNDNIQVCDHQITRNPLFGDINNFKTLLSGTPIHIISPNTFALKHNNIDELLEVEISYTYVDNNRKTLLHDIENIQEDVVLFGASLYGKDLGVLLKSKGKISLDFGATLDAWAGLCTRPWFKNGNMQHHCLIKR